MKFGQRWKIREGGGLMQWESGSRWTTRNCLNVALRETASGAWSKRVRRIVWQACLCPLLTSNVLQVHMPRREASRSISALSHAICHELINYFAYFPTFSPLFPRSCLFIYIFLSFLLSDRSLIKGVSPFTERHSPR